MQKQLHGSNGRIEQNLIQKANSKRNVFFKNKKNKVIILEILHEVGFNSESSFNTAFKKHTENRSIEYRNSLQTSILQLLERLF